MSTTDDDTTRISRAMGEIGSALETLGRDGKLRDRGTLFERFRHVARKDDTQSMAHDMEQLAKDARRAAAG
ncbi:MAG: hypothetical protein AB7I08_02340 [Thermoleophilia bacterium]